MSSWKEGQWGTKCFLSWFWLAQKKFWIKDETAFAVAKELQFETYLGRHVPDISPDWQWELILTGRLQKKSGKNRQRDFFSVSHREIPHCAGHKIWYPRAHSAFAKKNTFWSYMMMQIRIWMKNWNLISAHCTLPISRSQEGNKTYSDESGERFYFRLNSSHILAFLEKEKSRISRCHVKWRLDKT